MVTDELVSSTFINSIVKRDINLIYKTQENVIRQNFPNAGNLANYLAQRPFRHLGTDTKPIYFMRIFSYLRFLDIKYSGRSQMEFRRSLSIYNRVIWGVLYNETLQDLRYGFTRQVKQYIREELEQNREISIGSITSFMR